MLTTCVDDVLYFGDGSVCKPENHRKYAIIHACKEPCHRHAVGYSGNLRSTHPNYLAFETDNQLYLNLIDPPTPLFMPESFRIFLEFCDRFRESDWPLLIHCNQGASRAPSLALLYMAKRLELIPNQSFSAARKAFSEQFPYNPGAGIVTFLKKNWLSLE